MKAANLTPGQFYILFAEKATGIIIDKKGDYKTADDQDYFEIFDSLKIARQKALLIVKDNTLVEVAICDHLGNCVEVID